MGYIASGVGMCSLFIPRQAFFAGLMALVEGSAPGLHVLIVDLDAFSSRKIHNHLRVALVASWDRLCGIPVSQIMVVTVLDDHCLINGPLCSISLSRIVESLCLAFGRTTLASLQWPPSFGTDQTSLSRAIGAARIA